MHPTDFYKLYLSDDGLCIDFPHQVLKEGILSDCIRMGIDFMQDLSENKCLIKAYDERTKQGAFVSQQGYVGIAFGSEEDRFYFKTMFGITNEQIFASPIGQESRLFFNVDSSEKILHSALYIEPPARSVKLSSK